MAIVFKPLALLIVALLVLWIAGRRLEKLHGLLLARGSKVINNWQPGKISNFFFGYSFSPMAYIASPIGIYVLSGRFRKEDDPALRQAGRGCFASLIFGFLLLLLFAAYTAYLAHQTPHASH